MQKKTSKTRSTRSKRFDCKKSRVSGFFYVCCRHPREGEDPWHP
jgi:hypothetical protein